MRVTSDVLGVIHIRRQLHQSGIVQNYDFKNYFKGMTSMRKSSTIIFILFFFKIIVQKQLFRVRKLGIAFHSLLSFEWQ